MPPLKTYTFINILQPNVVITIETYNIDEARRALLAIAQNINNFVLKES